MITIERRSHTFFKGLNRILFEISGIFLSFFGRLILVVISLPRIFENEYLIAERKTMVEDELWFVKFDAMNDLISSEFIVSGLLFENSRSFSFADK